MKVFMMLAVSSLLLVACKENPGKGEPGYELLNSRCSRCHQTGIKKAHTTREEWDNTVTRMMAKGAAMNPSEKATLLDFLVKYYQPGSNK